MSRFSAWHAEDLDTSDVGCCVLGIEVEAVEFTLEPGAEGAIAALADPTRRQILELLSERGPQSASTLAARLPITRQAIAKHLRILTDARLVRSDRDGREVRFGIVTGGAADAASWLAATADRWQQRIDRLHRLVEG